MKAFIMNNNLLSSLMDQIKIVKDRIRGVVHGMYTGMYLFGRPGTSKSHIVRSTLDALAINHKYSNGHLTSIGLFELLQDNHDRVIVIDDISSLFSEPVALQILLAALGNSYDKSNTRWVNYKTAKGDVKIPFTGGIIAISNTSLRGNHKEVLGALKDRIYTIHYEPSNDQVIALIEDIASGGVKGINSVNCKTVCRFLIKECQVRSIRPSVRLFVDKALPDYSQWAAGLTETHWQDLIRSELEQQLVELQHPTTDLGRTEQIDAERRIAYDIYLHFDSLSERIKQWATRTGKSQAAYYRRIKELQSMGEIK